MVKKQREAIVRHELHRQHFVTRNCAHRRALVKDETIDFGASDRDFVVAAEILLEPKRPQIELKAREQARPRRVDRKLKLFVQFAT